MAGDEFLVIVAVKFLREDFPLLRAVLDERQTPPAFTLLSLHDHSTDINWRQHRGSDQDGELRENPCMACRVCPLSSFGPRLDRAKGRAISDILL